MQARIYLQPLSNAAGDYQPEFRIDDDLVNKLKIGQRMGKSKWTAGLLYPASNTLEFDNSDGRYGPSTSASSVFALAGADKARLRVEYPLEDGSTSFQTIYRGFVQTKGSTADMFTGKSRWAVRTPDIVLVDQSLNAGLITNGMTVREAIAAVFTDLDIAAYLPALNMDNFYDPNPGGTIINDEEELLGEERQADQVLEKLLLAGDNFLTYVPYRNEVRVMRRAELSGGDARTGYRLPWSSGDVVAPQDITGIEDGVERVYNQISCTTGRAGSDAVVTVENRGSISRWGRRDLKLDMSWSRDLAQVDKIARNLLARMSSPLRTLEVVVPSLQLTAEGSLQVFGQEAIVGGLVGVNIPAAAGEDAARYGTAEYGKAAYAEVTYPAIQGNFYIENIERDLHTDLTKLFLREFILD